MVVEEGVSPLQLLESTKVVEQNLQRNREARRGCVVLKEALGEVGSSVVSDIAASVLDALDNVGNTACLG
jgi:hypothetical protein